MVGLTGLEKFSHLEDKIYRTIELTKTLRQEKEALERELAATRREVGNLIDEKDRLEAQVERLLSERDTIRMKVEAMLDAIAALDPDWGAGLIGDKAHSMVFDNAKLRSLVPDYVATVPFHRGAREIVAWYDEDPSRQQADPRLDAVMDRLVETYRPGR